MNENIRWKQRFQNFEKSFDVFQRRINEYRDNSEKEAYKMALIQSFEMTVELSWKTLKDYLESESLKVTTPKEAVRQAYQSECIADGDAWMEALRLRNMTSHTYDEATSKLVLTFVDKVFSMIVNELYVSLKKKL